MKPWQWANATVALLDFGVSARLAVAESITIAGTNIMILNASTSKSGCLRQDTVVGDAAYMEAVKA